jgi:hypothetical protein
VAPSLLYSGFVANPIMAVPRGLKRGTISPPGRSVSAPTSSDSPLSRLRPSSSSTSQPSQPSSPIPADSPLAGTPPTGGSSSSGSVRSSEAIQLQVESILSEMEKAERGSPEVLHIVLRNADTFVGCSSKDARRLWSATTIKGKFNVSARGRALDHIRSLLPLSNESDTATPSESDNPVELESNLESLDDGKEASSGPSLRVSAVSLSSPSPSQPGRPSRHSRQDAQQQLLDSALSAGEILTDTQLRGLSTVQRERYDNYIRAQQEALKALKKHKKSASSSRPKPAGVESSPPQSVHWRDAIPQITFDQSTSPSHRQRPPKSRGASKRKATSSMDDDSSHGGRSRKSSGKSPSTPPASDSSESDSDSDFS